MRFQSKTAFVNAFYPKNLKRATPVSDFHFLLRSGLRFHCSCAHVLFTFSLLFTIVSFVHSFIFVPYFVGIDIFVPYFVGALAFQVTVPLYLLLHIWSSLVCPCSATATASAAAFVVCLYHSDHQQPWFTERLVFYLNFFEFLFNILNLYFCVL